MNKTTIEWVQNPDGSQGYTWNPITGCLNHVDGKCKGGGFPCYAYRLANTRLKDRYKANDNIAIPLTGMDLVETHRAYCNPFYPRFWPERLSEPVWLPSSHRRPTPKGIFVCDMSDLFGIGIPEEWAQKVLDTIKACPQHRFYLLTKQPQNLAKFSPFPDNCWVGVTATNCSMFAEACYRLKNVEAKVKYLSLEPMLDFRKLPEIGTQSHFLYEWLAQAGINQVIIGAQTKPTVQPKIEWVEEIVRACDKAGVAVFLKNNLKPIMGGYPIPKENMWAYRFERGAFNLRQEMPK